MMSPQVNTEQSPAPGQESAAVHVRTQFAEIGGKRIAYRSIGRGTPILLCNRLRGILDSWDPAFLDELAKSCRVIIFDYSGVGSSSGVLPITLTEVAEDVSDLAAFLHFEQFMLGGWSYGGLVAQTFATRHPDKVTHLILLGTNPPGMNQHPLEEKFLEVTLHPENDLDDEIILFFEPESALSREAARLSHERIAGRTVDLDIPVPQETWNRYFESAKEFYIDEYNAREKLGKLNIPILVISGDHDPACPIENWYALSGKIPNMQLIMLGQTGHGPQHQYPSLTVRYIESFVQNFKS